MHCTHPLLGPPVMTKYLLYFHPEGDLFWGGRGGGWDFLRIQIWNDIPFLLHFLK